MLLRDSSLSARRAWIEICYMTHPRSCNARVALRKESVDRNFCHEIQAYTCTGSLSARRAWIEMGRVNSMLTLIQVALRKESVDRNLIPSH